DVFVKVHGGIVPNGWTRCTLNLRNVSRRRRQSLRTSRNCNQLWLDKDCGEGARFALPGHDMGECWHETGYLLRVNNRKGEGFMGFVRFGCFSCLREARWGLTLRTGVLFLAALIAPQVIGQIPHGVFSLNGSGQGASEKALNNP